MTKTIWNDDGTNGPVEICAPPKVERATELEYLTWFRCEADFGPGESDYIDSLNHRFMDKTGKNLPEGWNLAQDGETVIDR